MQSEADQNTASALPLIICWRTSGIGGPPIAQELVVEAFHAFCPPRLAVQSSRSLRIISLPIV